MAASQLFAKRWQTGQLLCGLSINVVCLLLLQRGKQASCLQRGDKLICYFVVCLLLWFVYYCFKGVSRSAVLTIYLVSVLVCLILMPSPQIETLKKEFTVYFSFFSQQNRHAFKDLIKLVSDCGISFCSLTEDVCFNPYPLWLLTSTSTMILYF